MTNVAARRRLVKSLTNPLADRPRPIGDLMREAHRRLVQHLDDALHEDGWTDVKAPHASVLATVDMDGSRLAVLVERGGRTKQATAELAGHLVSAGYLRLVPDATDRRAKLYIPTKRGIALLSSCGRIVTAYEKWLDDAVGRNAVEQLRKTLIAIVSHED